MESSDQRVSEWLTTCGVAFPVGFDTLERLGKAGMSKDVAGAAVTGRYFYLLSNPSDELIARILASAQPGAVAPRFSVDDRAKVIQTLDTPAVAAVRTLLNRYRSTRQLMTDPDDQRRAALLDALPSGSLSGPFTVFAVNPLLAGGEVVTIMFAQPSHLMLDVHVKDGVVSFLRPKSLSTEARDRLAAYYRDILKDADYLR